LTGLDASGLGRIGCQALQAIALNPHCSCACCGVSRTADSCLVQQRHAPQVASAHCATTGCCPVASLSGWVACGHRRVAAGLVLGAVAWSPAVRVVCCVCASGRSVSHVTRHIAWYITCAVCPHCIVPVACQLVCARLPCPGAGMVFISQCPQVSCRLGEASADLATGYAHGLIVDAVTRMCA
jgi:hypothetical protein